MSSLRIFALTGLWLLMIIIGIIAIDMSESFTRVDHQIEYAEYETVDTYSPVTVTTPQVCAFNDTTQGETCHEATSHTEYRVTGSTQVAVESSRIEKIEDIDGGFRVIKNSYSKDGVLSIWRIPVGDRNYEEFGQCQKYEIDKGVCKQVAINE